MYVSVCYKYLAVFFSAYVSWLTLYSLSHLILRATFPCSSVLPAVRKLAHSNEMSHTESRMHEIDYEIEKRKDTNRVQAGICNTLDIPAINPDPYPASSMFFLSVGNVEEGDCCKPTLLAGYLTPGLTLTFVNIY